jgi:hypothetical protein
VSDNDATVDCSLQELDMCWTDAQVPQVMQGTGYMHSLIDTMSVCLAHLSRACLATYMFCGAAAASGRGARARLRDGNCRERFLPEKDRICFWDFAGV